MNISDARALPEQARGTWITANAFSLLRQPTLLGRDFSPADDRKGAEPVVIISYTFWKNRYGADPNVLGTSVRVNGQPATIVGVMPDGMRFPDNTEVWVPAIPTEAQEATRRALASPSSDGWRTASRREALTEMNGIAKRLAAAYPDTYKNLPGVRVETFTERYVGGAAKTMFLVMMGAVGFVLLIACANVANLLLSRSANRAREIAVRTALGATRWRVVRQLLVESLVLAFVGGSFGLLLAYAGVRVFDAVAQRSRQALLDRLQSRLRRLRIRRRDLRADGHPLRSRARPPRVEDEQQRGAEGRRTGHAPATGARAGSAARWSSPSSPSRSCCSPAPG